MRRFVFLFLLFSSISFAGELIRYPESTKNFADRLHWAFQTSGTRSGIWVGYSVNRLMYPNEIFMSGVSINGDFRFDKNKQTLQEWVSGVKILPKREVKDVAENELNRLEKKKMEKVWKEIGIFQKFQKRQILVPEKTVVIDMSMPQNFDGPMYWLGNATPEESFQNLSNQYAHFQNAEQKEQVMAAIAIHPPAFAFPFFKKILTDKEPEKVQESAAIFTGEIGTPEALALLRQVAEINPWKDVREGAVVGISEMDTQESLKILTQVAISHPDKNLRETAMAMLSDKHDPLSFSTLKQIAWFDPDSDMRETAVVMLAESEEGVPILLSIMEDHPSKETREIAVQMLAETVAGRQILKKKVKE